MKKEVKLLTINDRQYIEADHGRFEAELIEGDKVIAVTSGTEVVMYRGIREDVQAWAEMRGCDRVLRRYEIRFISGHTLKYTVKCVNAVSEQDAIDKAFDVEGHNFENRLISVKEVHL